jgi:hypothetical protein
VCVPERARGFSNVDFFEKEDLEPEQEETTAKAEDFKTFDSLSERSEFYDFMIRKLCKNGKSKNVARNIANSCCIQVENQKMTESTQRDFKAFKMQNLGIPDPADENDKWRDSLIAEIFKNGKLR